MTDPNVAGNPRLSHPRLDLLTPAGKCDRSKVFADAWKTFRTMRRIDDGSWTFPRCLSFAWSRAKAQKKLFALASGEARGARKRRTSGYPSSQPQKTHQRPPHAIQWGAFQ
jgi:hypothetical protein